MAPLVKEKVPRKPNISDNILSKKKPNKPNTKPEGIKEVTPLTSNKSKVVTPSKSKLATPAKPKVTTLSKTKVATLSKTVATPSHSKVATPAEKKIVAPSTIKKSKKHRPLPAHSGVPVPEKLRKLLEKQLWDADDSFQI